MKTIAWTALALLMASPAFANTQEDVAKVRALVARKISGSDVRVKIEVYVNNENNPCAEPGTNYLAHVKTRKSVMRMSPSGDPSQAREWRDQNMYSISKADLDKGGDVSDALCQE